MPSMGFVNTPAIPFPTPESNVIPAYLSPCPTLFAFFAFYFYLYLEYSSSNVIKEKPFPKAPVILLMEFKAPAKVFLTNEPAPLMTPSPPSKGPLTKPSLGFKTRSYNPVPILVKSPTGFPISSRLPRSKNIYLIKSLLYLMISLLVIPSRLSQQCESLMPFKSIEASSMFIIEEPIPFRKTIMGLNCSCVS
jgi:hypothetical protein